MAFLDDFVTNVQSTLSNISTNITNFVRQDSYYTERVAEYQSQSPLSSSSVKQVATSALSTQQNSNSTPAETSVKRVQANTQKQGNNSANVSTKSSGSETKSTENTITNVYDKIIDTRNTMYAEGAVSIVSAYKEGTLASTEGVKSVATLAAPLAADVLLPLDAINVGQKILTGRISELTSDDWVGAGIDALGMVAGLFTFGAGYLATKGVKTGVKVLQTGSKVAKGTMVAVSAKGTADLVGTASTLMEN